MTLSISWPRAEKNRNHTEDTARDPPWDHALFLCLWHYSILSRRANRKQTKGQHLSVFAISLLPKCIRPPNDRPRNCCRVGAWMGGFIELVVAVAQYRSTLATCRRLWYRVTSALLVDITQPGETSCIQSPAQPLAPLASMPTASISNEHSATNIPQRSINTAKLKTVYTTRWVTSFALIIRKLIRPG